MEINISSSLKSEIQRKLKDLTAELVEKELCERVELQVYQMLLDPFNRFLLRGKIQSDEIAGMQEGEDRNRGSATILVGSGTKRASTSKATGAVTPIDA